MRRRVSKVDNMRAYRAGESWFLVVKNELEDMRRRYNSDTTIDEIEYQQVADRIRQIFDLLPDRINLTHEMLETMALECVDIETKSADQEPVEQQNEIFSPLLPKGSKGRGPAFVHNFSPNVQKWRTNKKLINWVNWPENLHSILKSRIALKFSKRLQEMNEVTEYEIEGAYQDLDYYYTLYDVNNHATPGSALNPDSKMDTWLEFYRRLLSHEVSLMNMLLDKMRRDIFTLKEYLFGKWIRWLSYYQISLQRCLLNNEVPKIWLREGFYSKINVTLTQWLEVLSIRHRYLLRWT